MSDLQRGPGWWQATDGKWYPPEMHPRYKPPPPPPPPPPPSPSQPRPGWWQATDGKWYPPEMHPRNRPPAERAGYPPTTPSQPPTRATGKEAPLIPPLTAEDRPVLLVIGGMVTIAVGCFLPWATITAPFVGTMSKNGIDGDGQLFLVVAVVGAGVAWAYRSTRHLAAWINMGVLIGLLGLGLLFEVADIAGMQNRFADAEAAGQELVLSASYGVGLWLVGLGIAAAVFGFVKLERPQRERRRRRS